MTRCGEFYKLFEDEAKSCSVTHQCLERPFNVKKRRIGAYLGLRDLFRSQGVPEASFYCLFPENAARPLWSEKDGEIREVAIGKIIGRCLNGERTTMRDTIELLQEGRVYKPQEFPDGVFSIILADPPWQYRRGTTTPNRTIEKQYDTMTLEDIKDYLITPLESGIIINEQIADNAILFLWSTVPLVQEALAVMQAWGFEYKTMFTWNKEKRGLGHWLAIRTENLLVGVKGEFKPPKDCNVQENFIKEKWTKHSKKPQASYDAINKMYPTATKKDRLELFGREERENWTVWGIEIDKINERREMWASYSEV